MTVSNVAAPTLARATYNWSTGALVITGGDFVANAGANNDLDASLLTLTGADGQTYTLTDTADVEITSATSATLTLSATDRLHVHGLLNQNGTASGATTYNLAAADNWMVGSPADLDIADVTGNGITVSNVATPVITSATYERDSGALVVTGTGFFKKPGLVNDIDLSTLTFTGGSSGSFTLTTATDVEIDSATQFSAILSGDDKTGVDALLDQMGTQSSGGTTYNLAAAEDWLAGAVSSANIADASNAITVSVAPRLTSATYNATTGALVVTGTNIQAKVGATNDIDASLFTLTGEDGATYTLTDTPDVERDSATQFTLTLSATDKVAINQILNKNAGASTSGTTYNLAAADDWCANVTAGETSDATNSVLVSNVPAPTIASAAYNASTGVLTVTGTGFVKRATNDIDVSKLTLKGEGGSTHTLTSRRVEITSDTSFSVTLNAADQAAVGLFVNKDGTASTSGTTYNLDAASPFKVTKRVRSA